ncbi:hypothetical protein SDRG_01797 [Saprolegnia diclina VS20]|uniref:PDZ domain-containing protein n=1 Tax=Saprolegnia diclina (strain VS20) TaxID=1156394 RepID=T0R307_SAPDV|nr:hypothetical protein SDRG_01797 [Saprolegnia diclina VS20]EQC40725.1 hypothetical protein SDRG_01797 [Saprolegnia diclina VS20]|eukprot:XP_008605569.1 hypothetical protein SDRG_01797 [Saprolegnia diclina VS20]
MTATEVQEAAPTRAVDHGSSSDEVLELTFAEPGDLGIRIAFDHDGHVLVKKIESVPGPVERICPDLTPGDVLVAINATNVLPYSFRDVMKKLREAKSSDKPMQLAFLPKAGASFFTSTESLVEAWLREEQAHMDDGEFEVIFPPSQPLGFQLGESFLMVKPFVVTDVEVDAAWAARIRGKCVVKINDHVVLGAPVDDVRDLLSSIDPSLFPKQLSLLRLSASTPSATPDDDYDIVTIPTSDWMPRFRFALVERMLEVPTIEPFAAALDRPLLSPRTSKERRRDGIAPGQLLIAINGISALGIHADRTPGSSHVGMVTVALEKLENEPRSLLVRDLTLYEREFRAQRPLSPWRRRCPSPPTAGDSSAVPSSTITVASAPRVLTELLTSSLARVPASTGEALDARQTWVTSRLRHVTIQAPSASEALGLSLETDFSTKYTVFHKFERAPSPALERVDAGDRLTHLNGAPIETLDTAAIIDFLRSSEDKTPRTVRVLKARSSLPKSLMTSWKWVRRSFTAKTTPRLLDTAAATVE